METKVLNVKGEEIGKVRLEDAVFGLKPQPTFLHEVITALSANRRKGSADTKTRSEVSGGGRKPWKQKHTGRARAGTIRSPLWRKGGIVFGPHPRSYRKYLPNAKRHAALAQALSAVHAAGALQVVDRIGLDAPKTKQFAEILRNLKLPAKSLIVLDRPDPVLARAGRNIEKVSLACVLDLNAYTVLKCRRLVLTEAALQELQKNLAPRLTVEAPAKS